MASMRSAITLTCCIVVLAYACSAVSAADAKSAAVGPKLQHPIGSGKNLPASLGSRHGRRFLKLMEKFVEAARGGNMPLVLKLQQQLFSLTKPKHHKRHLLQPAEDACPALPGSEEIVDPAIPPSGAEESSGPDGPAPSLRFFTLEPCAEFGCRGDFTLVRQADGTITCEGPGDDVPAVEVEEFAYTQVYDEDKFWDTEADNVLAGGYAGTVLSNTNELTSSRGAAALTSSLESDTQVHVVPNPFIGVRGDTKVGGEVSTGVEVSKAVGDVAVLDFKTALPVVSAGGVYGSVLPGTVVTEREGEPSDDNVAIRTNAPALFGYFGKKH